MIKRIQRLILALFLMCGCASQQAQKENEVHSTEETIINDLKNDEKQEIKYTEENTSFIISQAEYMIDIGDPNALNEIADTIALVKVNTIDCGTCTNPETGEGMFPHTVGKFTIIEIYKGEYTPNQQLTYYRPGGIVTYEEYYNSLRESQKMKIDLNDGNIPEYVSMYMDEDISIEEGKTYLVYCCSSSIQDTVGIIGFAGGLREYNDGLVLDNFTGEYEPLEKALPK